MLVESFTKESKEKLAGPFLLQGTVSFRTCNNRASIKMLLAPKVA